jgi:hypothetical protein
VKTRQRDTLSGEEAINKKFLRLILYAQQQFSLEIREMERVVM